VAGIPGDEATVKRFSSRNGTVVLTPANRRLSPMEFSARRGDGLPQVVTVLRRL